MRMRRLKWAPSFLKESNMVIQVPSDYKGKWKSHFKKEKLHIEIGTGKGDYWIGMSQLYPEVMWVGIEKNESVAALAVRKSGEVSDNRRFIYGDASIIDEWFAPGEVDVIHLNFSDPWPKNRTKKRRLSHSSFLQKYQNILHYDGEIQMKTDNSSLFEYSILEFAEHDFKLIDFSVDFRREPHDEDTISEYESKFMEKGNPIYRAVWKRK